jgi:ADP-heptose:LPS heptosyltransferase
MPAEERLLVISEIGIGDGLTLIPVLHQLRNQRPGLHVDMIAAGLESIGENFQGIVSIIGPNELLFKNNEDRAEWLRNREYTYVWNTQNERSPWRSVLHTFGNTRWISSPPHNTWKQKYILDIRLNQLQTLFPDLRTYPPLKLALTERQVSLSHSFTSRYPGKNLFIGIHPSAKDRTKAWSIDKYIQTAKLLSELPSVRVFFFAAPGETDSIAQKLPADHRDIEIVTGSLSDAIANLSACNVFIGNDSGFYHLAYALGLKVIGLYRSRRNLKIWSHPSERSKHIYFYLPAFARMHWRKFISVERVYNTALELTGSDIVAGEKQIAVENYESVRPGFGTQKI